jgi:hypothetical protein
MPLVNTINRMAQSHLAYAEAVQRGAELLKQAGSPGFQERSMRKVKIGDVVEIRTRKGLAYAHYTHKHKLYGALLRVFNDISDAPLNTYEDVVKQRPAFSVFFPLRSRQGITFTYLPQ